MGAQSGITKSRSHTTVKAFDHGRSVSFRPSLVSPYFSVYPNLKASDGQGMSDNSSDSISTMTVASFSWKFEWETAVIEV